MIGDYHTKFILEAIAKSASPTAVLLNASDGIKNFAGLSLEVGKSKSSRRV